MTAVHLTTLVFTDAEDPDDALVLHQLKTYRRKPTAGARSQAVAGGGWRVIRTEGTQRVWDVTAVRCPVTTTDWLEAHVGRILCVRDDSGRKFFAWYGEPDFDEVPKPRTADVAFTLTEASWSEAV